mmetsp:Transcript_18122/g.42054  ORF Transcript_18122/g.42054 Transcript_18122/m.42054 type:complete len:402 (-) Transcript_18122:32-1237(-)|eukprot:18213-Amphidinium_carterae.1
MQAKFPASEELSDFRAWANIVKSCVGMTLLMLPRSISRVGFVPACIGLAVMALSNYWGAVIVAKCRASVEGGDEDGLLRIEAQSGKVPIESVWDSGYGYLDKLVAVAFGKRSQLLCVLCLFGLGVIDGIDYVKLISQTASIQFPGLQPKLALLGTGCILMVCSLANRLRYVAFLSVTGLLVYLVVFTCLVSEATNHHHTTYVALEWWKTKGYDYGAFFAAANWIFSSLPVADRVFREMQNKSHFVYVSLGACASVLLIALAVGLVGYYGYGLGAEEFIHFSFTGSASRICVIAIAVVATTSWTLLQVPVFMLLQAQLPDVPYAIINVSVVWSEVFLAYLFPDITTILETFGMTCSLLGCWIFPGLTFLYLSHPRHERGARTLTVAVMLLGFICGAASFGSA